MDKLFIFSYKEKTVIFKRSLETSFAYYLGIDEDGGTEAPNDRGFKSRSSF